MNTMTQLIVSHSHPLLLELYNRSLQHAVRPTSLTLMTLSSWQRKHLLVIQQHADECILSIVPATLASVTSGLKKAQMELSQVLEELQLQLLPQGDSLTDLQPDE